MWKIILILLPFYIFAVPDFELYQGNHAPRWKKLNSRDLQDVQFYKKIFDENYQEEPCSEQRIPQVLHFIWLGSKPFPHESIKNILSWKQHHPQWKFKFWTDDPKRDVPCPDMEKHLISELELQFIAPFLEKTKNLGERSDMLRYEILLREGGIYVDHDVFCYRSFSAFNALYDFYACLETPHIAEGQRTQIFACNCVVGAISGHPLLQSALKIITDQWNTVEANYSSETARVMHRSFFAFSEAIREHAADPHYRNIIFPAYYFFPNQVYSHKLQKKLHLENKAYASHAFAGLWTDGPSLEIQNLKKKQREQLKKIYKRINRLYYLSGSALVLALILLLMYVRKSAKSNYRSE